MSDDLISRQAAIEYFMTNTNWHDEDGYPIDDAEEKRKLIEDYFNGISSAEPSCSEIPKKTGRWINISPLLTAARCSECKSAFADKTNYCPYCGAKMKEIDSNE